MMMRPTDGAGLACTCRQCGMVLRVIGARLTDAALASLRDHVRVAHPGMGLRADASAGAVLAHFTITPTPAAST